MTSDSEPKQPKAKKAGGSPEEDGATKVEQEGAGKISWTGKITLLVLMYLGIKLYFYLLAMMARSHAT